MANRRDQIKLTPEEQAELLDEERIVVCTTNGPRGWPHSMPPLMMLMVIPNPGARPAAVSIAVGSH